MDKTERHLNLVALLLDARHPVTLAKIRDSLYADQPSEEAFKRMFERDKEELRALGMRIDFVQVGWEDGYVAQREDVTLPDLDLTPAEHAALMLALQMWGDGMLGTASARMTGMKIAASASDDVPEPWILPQVGLRSPHVTPLVEAINGRKRVTFRYRASGATKAEERKVEPHAVRFRGAWYLFGHDVARGEARSFKLDRIEGSVKVAKGKDPDFDPVAPAQTRWPGIPAETDPDATLAVNPDLAWWAQRQPGVRVAGEHDDGRALLTVGVPDEDRFLRWAMGFGDAAEVLAPPHLREAIVERLRAAAGFEGEA